ncbi:arginase [Salpingoeca rosetta]|uniref:Arginase n=1 Tax=Salpingoeca rosetta (strain ATCC 50818 / BSB-021) TaxID=946362 RepID=F2UDL5_SALR5|nr:arginase [Salpingoeca rosetta]EGD74710.1 arginase [Salpingoeca rosetta]|eukprot:XP_004992967.1 arginase [Salpingoeca rosetta]
MYSVATASRATPAAVAAVAAARPVVLAASSHARHKRSVSSTTPAGHAAAGLGVGNIRSGLEAVHRVEVPCPTYLKNPKTCAVIGAPLSFGQPFDGVQRGPTALREAGLLDGIMKLGWRVTERGDLDFGAAGADAAEYAGPGNCKLAQAVGAANEKIYRATSESAEQGKFVLTLGGDHSLATGTLAGALSVRPDVGVLWIDAHADINIPETSPSGNMHGMPLGLVAGLCDCKTIPGHAWLADVPKLDLNNLVYVGLRDLDIAERALIRSHNIKAFTMYHVDKYGIGKVMEMALDHLDKRPIHLSYDIDACDPVIAPSTGTAVRGGLSYREAHFVAEAAAETGSLVSMDLVEVNPLLKGEEAFGISLGEETVELGMAIATSALGNRIL